MLTDKDGLPGLRLETAASVIVRNFVHDHFTKYMRVIRRDRAAATSVHIEFVNALAGASSLIVAGGHASREEVIDLTMKKFREYLDRDLQHLARNG